MFLRSLPRSFWGILLAALIVRFIVAVVAPHPGISDSNHYYNLARNLADGRGFVIDYIWQYHTPPLDVTHPTDYWMPLPALAPAVMLSLFPDQLLAALIPSVIVGTLIIALTYALAAHVGLGVDARILAMLGVVFLPEFVLNSARTDTTLLYVLFVGVAALMLYRGMNGQPWALFIAGMAAGLAQLSRQDAIMLAPAFVLTVIAYWRWGDWPLPWRHLLLIPLGWVLVLSPWLVRNYQTFGYLLPSGAGRTLFMTSFIDQFTYGRDLTLDHYLSWGWGNILSNIAVQALANVRMSYLLLDVLMPVTAFIGLGLIVARRERKILLMVVFPTLAVVGLFLSYSFLTPFHTQGGSFKKSYMLLIPFLSVVSAYAITQLIANRRLMFAVGWVGALFMLANAFQLIRSDFTLARAFNQSNADFVAEVAQYGDVNGDGEIIIMTQDPFMINYHGYRALMIPSDPRDMILEAAYRYNVDYIQMPADRAALDELYDGSQTDPRLELIRLNDPVYRLLKVVPPA